VNVRMRGVRTCLEVSQDVPRRMEIETISRCYWFGHDREPRRSRVKVMV
jgi:hypothetical protein